MIITCPCNKKKFEVDASLIPDNGRNIQCGVHVKMSGFIKKMIKTRQK